MSFYIKTIYFSATFSFIIIKIQTQIKAWIYKINWYLVFKGCHYFYTRFMVHGENINFNLMQLTSNLYFVFESLRLLTRNQNPNGIPGIVALLCSKGTLTTMVIFSSCLHTLYIQYTGLSFLGAWWNCQDQTEATTCFLIFKCVCIRKGLSECFIWTNI